MYETPNQDYIEKILSYVELENAGVDLMAYMQEYIARPTSIYMENAGAWPI